MEVDAECRSRKAAILQVWSLGWLPLVRGGVLEYLGLSIEDGGERFETYACNAKSYESW